MRPREKFLEKGGQNLRDEELLALLLGSGSVKLNVLALAKLVLKKYPLHQLKTVTAEDLQEIHGVGKTKATRLMAALELGQRIFAQASVPKIVVQTSADVLTLVRDIADKRQEYLIVLYLNARHELIDKKTVGVGSLNTANIEPRDILSHALITPCASLILAHNHPSGDATPSEDDVRFTLRIQEASMLLGIDLTDHVILSSSGFYSLREHKLFH